MRKNRNKVESFAVMRRKLYSAIAMLLVSSIMLVSSSYAWLVLSTAPEVTGIETQVGANGSLEIVLLDTESYNDITKVREADIDESATVSGDALTISNNLSWGNIVDLGSSTYGLHDVVLNPSRLNIARNGNDSEGNAAYKVNSILLKTPIYGEDGRITGLEQTAIAPTYDVRKGFTQANADTYGVRAIGTASNMTQAQLGINTARSTLVTSMSAAKTAASNALSANGSSLGNIALKYASAKKEDKDAEFSASDIQAMIGLAEDIEVSLDYIDTAMRQVYLGYICTAESGVTTDTYQEEKTYIENMAHSLSDLKTRYPGVTTASPDVTTYIQKLEKNQTDVANAITKCNEMLATNAGSYTDTQIFDVMRPLVNHEQIMVAGKTVNELINMGFSDLANVILDGGLSITIPSGSGLLSDIADFAGDYTAKITMTNISFGDFHMDSATANMSTATEVEPVHLVACSNILKAYTAGGSSSGDTVITNFYGYALDLAFRTNVEDSHLLLQTVSGNRIYSDETDPTAGTWGEGSFMRFTSNAGLSASKMIKLMGALRVVFVDEEQNVLAMAALDTTLGQDVYEVLSTAEQESTKKHARLKVNAVQNSDYITSAEYDELAGKTTMVKIGVDDEGRNEIEAPLYLYNFSMTESKANVPAVSGNNLQTAADGDEGSGTGSSSGAEKKYTGGITLGNKKAKAEITSLLDSVPQQVSVIVYLDGSYVSNAMVAANSSQSMTGTLNLQFASDVQLIPMENRQLRGSEDQGSGGGES